MYLAGAYRSAGESTEELWQATEGRPVFRATMSLKRFKHISRILRFDDKETRTARRARDKLAPIRDVFDAWVTTLSKSFIPYDNVTIDEQLCIQRAMYIPYVYEIKASEIWFEALGTLRFGHCLCSKSAGVHGHGGQPSGEEPG